MTDPIISAVKKDTLSLPPFPSLDFKGEPIPPLKEAVKLGCLLQCSRPSPCYDVGVEMARFNYSNLDQRLLMRQGKLKEMMSFDEFAAIYLYTIRWCLSCNMNVRLNGDLRSEDRALSYKWKFYLHYFNSALNKIVPVRDQVLYRGIDVDVMKGFPQKYAVGNVFVDYSFVSTSTNINVARCFLEHGESGTLFTIRDAVAYSVSDYSYKGEDEHVILPISSFKVVSVRRDKQICHVELKHLPSKPVFTSPSPFFSSSLESGLNWKGMPITTFDDAYKGAHTLTAMHAHMQMPSYRLVSIFF